MLKSTLLIFFTFLLWECASRGVPGGGPRDTTPPVIIETDPRASTLNVHNLSQIHFRFSEAVNEASVVNKVYISPPLPMEISWPDDDELLLTLKQKLQANQTYVITLGRDLSDLHGNKMTGSFQLAFSTGSQIDKGVVAGTVFGLKKGTTFSVFAYLLSPSGQADVDSAAMYVSQTATDGGYQINYMRFGAYRLFAVDDQNNNQRIDAAYEPVGIPYRDVFIDSVSPAFRDLNFRMTQIDTSAPQVTRVQSFSSLLTRIFLSEMAVNTELNEFAIFDSLSNLKKNIYLVGRDVAKENVLNVYAPLDSARTYRIEIPALKDEQGNIGKPATFFFVARGHHDPDSLNLGKVTPADSSRNIEPDVSLHFAFSSPLTDGTLKNRFVLTSQKGDTVSVIMKRDDEKNFSFVPEQNLTFDTWYHFELSLGGVQDVAGQVFGDTVISRSFHVKSSDDYGSLIGSIWAEGSGTMPFVIIARALNGNYKQQTVVREDRSFRFPFIPAGNYKLFAFADSDSNRTYSFGTLYPFHYAEPFVQLSDTIKIRKRWETSGVSIEFPSIK